ncbi:uncharacterized protein MKZ38_004018 [Zalerion maritima]|uniref:DAGKc domain-containing protein n=1 Tax=Zalerion maritima TaxID=339359 RepID=A0AAD5RTA1_9PEZI|nr:uncharacterized protein MKZ38_004018 [Zalerion maritima]
MGSSRSYPFDFAPPIKEDEVVMVVPCGIPGVHNTTFTLSVVPDDSNDHGMPFIHKRRYGPGDIFPEYVVDPSRLPAYLKTDLHVVVSTRSGTGKAEAFYDVLKVYLEAVGIHERGTQEGNQNEYNVVVTSHPGSVQEFARSTLSNCTRPTTVILLSGDGGVVDLLNNCSVVCSSLNSSAVAPTVALLPLGTGNALFHSIHRPLCDASAADDKPGPHPLVQALRTLFLGVPHRLPAFKASFSPCAKLVPVPSEDLPATDIPPLEVPTPPVPDSFTYPLVPNSYLLGTIVSSYGFHASLVYESDTPALRKFGQKRFGMAAAELLKTAHAYDAAVEYVPYNQEQQGWNSLGRDKHGYVLAAHVSNMEKTFRISPSSKPLDGKLWLVNFAPLEGEEVMKIMHAAYAGGCHVVLEGVGYFPVERLRVTVREPDPRWRKVCIDGTIVELEEGGWMEVSTGQESRLKVLVPQKVAEESGECFIE